MKRSRFINGGLVVALVAAGGGIYLAAGPKAAAKSNPATVDVSTGTVLASVSASGTAIPSQQVALNFTSSGVVIELDVKIGDRVSAGQVLAKIDPTNAQNQLTLAQAQLAAAQANLTALQTAGTSTAAVVGSGPSPAELQAQAQLAAAQANLQRDLAKLQAAQSQLASAQTTFQQAATTVKRDLAFQSTCLANPATPSSGGLSCASVATQVVIDTAVQTSDQATVTTTGISVGLAQQAVSSDQAAIATASATLGTSRSSATATAASATGSGGGGSSTGSIAQAQATLTSDQIALDNAQKALAATTMTAPSDGTVSALTGVLGQTASGGSGAATTSTGSSSGAAASGGAPSSSSAAATTSGSPSGTSAFITLTNLTSLQVQAAFTEADATKLVVGQKVIATFSALPNVQVQGAVAQLATTSTTSNNVVSFTTLINLDQVPTGLKPGMSATAQVIVGEADNAVFVPASAVNGTGGTGTVTVVNADGSQTVTNVSVGLRGDTTLQITSGLQKGQKVVRSSTVATAASGSTPRTGGAPGGFGGGGLGGAGLPGGAGRVGG